MSPLFLTQKIMIPRLNYNHLITMVAEKGHPLGKNYFIIGKKGDLDSHPVHWKTKEPLTDRTNAYVLVVNTSDNYLEWKMVYTNNKGYYVKLKLKGNAYFPGKI